MQRCPKCTEVLQPGATKCRACGWVEDEPQAETGQKPRPTLEDLAGQLGRLLARIPPDRWPERMPTDRTDAGRWFLDLIPPESRAERPDLVPVRGKQANAWHWPFAVRAGILIRKFCNVPPAFQRLIVAAAEDGHRWNGEDEPGFVRYIEEREKQAEDGADEYRQGPAAHLAAMRRTTRR